MIMMTSPSSVCENCGYDIRETTSHRRDGDGHCLIIDVETGQVRGAANRKQPKDMYRKK